MPLAITPLDADYCRLLSSPPPPDAAMPYEMPLAAAAFDAIFHYFAYFATLRQCAPLYALICRRFLIPALSLPPRFEFTFHFTLLPRHFSLRCHDVDFRHDADTLMPLILLRVAATFIRCFCCRHY